MHSTKCIERGIPLASIHYCISKIPFCRLVYFFSPFPIITNWFPKAEQKNEKKIFFLKKHIAGQHSTAQMPKEIKMGTWVRDRQRNTTKAPHLLTWSWDYFKVFLEKKKVKPGETECKRKKNQTGKKRKNKCYGWMNHTLNVPLNVTLRITDLIIL